MAADFQSAADRQPHQTNEINERRHADSASSAGLPASCAEPGDDAAPARDDLPQGGPVRRLARQPRCVGLGNEVLVGFSVGTHKDLGPDRHNIDRTRPERHLRPAAATADAPGQLRTRRSRVLIPAGKMLHGVPLRRKKSRGGDCPGGIDFTHPDFALTCA